MESLLTENEVLAHLKVSLACLRRWRLCGEGPQYVRRTCLGRIIDLHRSVIYAMLVLRFLRQNSFNESCVTRLPTFRRCV
jgi:hypothetical protein